MARRRRGLSAEWLLNKLFDVDPQRTHDALNRAERVRATPRYRNYNNQYRNFRNKSPEGKVALKNLIVNSLESAGGTPQQRPTRRSRPKKTVKRRK